MIEFIITTTVALFIAGGVFTEVVKPTSNYVIDQGKQGVEYIEEKLN